MERYIIDNTAENLAKWLLVGLGSGTATDNGDRVSDYYVLARDPRDGMHVSVSLTENIHGLDVDKAYYTLHIVDDVSGEPCDLQHSDALTEESLVKLLEEVMAEFKAKNEASSKLKQLCFWANYEYEDRPLCFVKFEDELPAATIVKVLKLFDLWYGNTDQDTPDWATEFQLVARMLLSDNALLVNPKYLELTDECLADLGSALSTVSSDASNQYLNAHGLTQDEINSLYAEQEG